ncbi:hypothetical protein DIE28_11255 [Paracoccus thiocyanatus]|uniref:Uncharacterized protein n=1 Tax=Paracoccus thiocyanatus TaxID=34006 RepID=A0A3D8PBP1_9RHOB|nr:hypothetical protein DIE28_11255 [Paracoccus thiocyanatus]
MRESGLYDLFRNRPLPTPMASPAPPPAPSGGRSDVLSQLRGHNSRHAGMMGTPTANAAPRGSVLRKHKGRMTSDQDRFDRSPTIGEALHFEKRAPEVLPTPTKRDSRMDGWSPAYDRRKSPTMDAVMARAMDGAMTDRAPDKWAGARALAAILRSHGLTGTAALPITYAWMMGFPPGWLHTHCARQSQGEVCNEPDRRGLRRRGGAADPRGHRPRHPAHRNSAERGLRWRGGE